MVEPAAPELATHQGRFGPHLFELAELVVDVGTRAEIDGPEQVIQRIVLEVRAPVALEELDIGKACTALIPYWY